MRMTSTLLGVPRLDCYASELNRVNERLMALPARIKHVPSSEVNILIVHDH